MCASNYRERYRKARLMIALKRNCTLVAAGAAGVLPEIVQRVNRLQTRDLSHKMQE